MTPTRQKCAITPQTSCVIIVREMKVKLNETAVQVFLARMTVAISRFPLQLLFSLQENRKKPSLREKQLPLVSFLHSLTTHTGCFFWNKSAWEGRKKKEKKRRVDAVHHPGNNVKEFRKVAPGLSLSLSIDHTKTKTRLDRVFSVCSFMHSV